MNDPAADHLREAIRLLRQDPHRAPSATAAELALALAGPAADFGVLLKGRRDAAGLSLQYLADRSGLSVNTLRNLETNRTKPAQDSLELLLKVPELGLSVIAHLPPMTPIEQRPNAFLTQRYDPSGMAQDLRAVVNGPGGTLEQSHLYLDNQSASDYLAVCEAYASTRGALFAELHRVGDLVAAMGQKVDVVAIGSGDGRAEVCLAQKLAQHNAAHRLYLLDISHTLLTRAYEHAALVLHPLDVKAIHGNFHELQRYPMIHGGAGKSPRLYTLLGATIANLADEMRFFRDLHSCSSPGDLALIDYQIAHDPPARDPALTAGAVPKILTDWHAGPLRRNNPNVRDISIKIELAPGRLPGSHAVVFVATATMADGSSRAYRVGSSSRYSTAALSSALAGTGWQTVHSAAYDPRTALMMLRRI